MLADILAQLQQKQASEGESGVTVAFELNWESLEPQTQKLACLLSIFALAPIPWSLVESAASACNLEFDIKASCTLLIQRYLLQQKAQDTYQIHERIRELLRLKLEDLAELETHHDASQLKRGFCQALVAVAQDIPQTPTQIQIAKASLAIPHLAEAATTYQDWLGDEDLIWVFIGLGRFYKGQGAYEQALPWFTQSLSATRKRFSEEHPDVATSLNNLALLYKSLGRYSEAEPLYIQALEIAEKVLGVNHPNTLTCRENLEDLRKKL